MIFLTINHWIIICCILHTVAVTPSAPAQATPFTPPPPPQFAPPPPPLAAVLTSTAATPTSSSGPGATHCDKVRGNIEFTTVYTLYLMLQTSGMSPRGIPDMKSVPMPLR